jgi:hypothetical protein
MRIFFDTEFTQFRDGELLSIGFVTENDEELVVEIHDQARHSRASDFCQQVVIPQFGTTHAHVVRDDPQAGNVVAQWLGKFSTPTILCYDFKLDWYFLEAALRAAGKWEQVAARTSAFNVADVANYDTCLQAQEEYFQTALVPGRHHPLVDAKALRERWREYERLEFPAGAA